MKTAAEGGAGLFGHIVLQRVVYQHEDSVAKKRAKCATILYVFLMLLSTAALLAYHVLKKETRLIEVQGEPVEGVEGRVFVSRDRHQEVVHFNPTCPCGNTNIAFGTFTDVDYTLHEVCDDAKVIAVRCLDDPTMSNCNGMPPQIGLPVFLGIIKMCNASNVAIENSVLDLRSRSIVTPNLVEPQSFFDQIRAAAERTRRAALLSVLSPLNVIEATNSIERPVTSVTLGSGEQQPPSDSGNLGDDPIRSVAMGRDGWAWIFEEGNIPGTDIPCNCFLSFDCEIPIPADAMGGYTDAKQKCSLLQTMLTVPVERVMTDDNDGRRLSEFDAAADGSVRRATRARQLQDRVTVGTRRDDGTSERTLGEIAKTTKGYCCEAPGPSVWCKQDAKCFLTSLCCEEPRREYDLDKNSLESVGYAAWEEYHRVPITSGPFQQVVQTGFLQDFTVEGDYAEYYDACAPTSCSYIAKVNLELYEIIGAVLGLIGGISVAFKGCLTFFVEFLPDSAFKKDSDEEPLASVSAGPALEMAAREEALEHGREEDD